MKTARIKEGYGMVQRDIMTNESVSALSKALYALLVSYAGEKSTCYPSINTICKNLKLSKPTIIKSITELKKEKLIVVKKQINKNGDYGNNVYEPLYLIEEVVNEVDYPSQLDLLGGKGDLPGVVKDVYPKNNSLRNNIEDIAFSKFWELYNHKHDKHKAEKAWSKLNAKERKDCLNGIPTYLEFLKRPEQQWQKQLYPATFINSKRWQDDYTAKIQFEENDCSLMPLN